MSTIEAISAKRTHNVPCVQFAFSDDTVLSESVGRAVITRFYPTRIRGTILGKTHRRGLPTSGYRKFIAQGTGVDVEQHHSWPVLARESESKKMIKTRKIIGKGTCRCGLCNQSILSSTRHDSTWSHMLEKHTWGDRCTIRAIIRWLLVDSTWSV
jgi:hypothetical protein